MAESTVNSVENIEVVPSGKAVGAEVRGVDFSKPVPDDVRDRLLDIWGEHMVLFFRKQSLKDEDILAVAGVYGGQQAAGSRAYFLKAGLKPGESHRVSKHAGISLVSNLDADGNPVRITQGIGSLEAFWHPPARFCGLKLSRPTAVARPLLTINIRLMMNCPTI